MTAAPESELVVAESGAIVPSADGARNALETYQQIQRVFDEKMPDAIMEIRGKKFRKKSYWRAIATAFNVEARMISEERIEIDGDWGYLATYRATTNDGRQCDGDGACMASEKSGAMCTVHNVRAHAHTRAKNRAIADLVGFGEVSADELGPDAFERGADEHRESQRRPAPAKAPRQTGAEKLANEKQTKMLFAKSCARAEALGTTGTDYEDEQELAGSIRKAAMTTLGFESKEEITFAAVTPMVKAIEAAEIDDEGRVVIPGGDL
jgi:hypothetical protein